MSSSSRPVAAVDIDGVVADVRHRLEHVAQRPKDWEAFFTAAAQDPLHDEGLAVVRHLEQDHEVVFLTGRPDRLAADTRRWLERHGMVGQRLLMRPGGDRRPAAQVKVELLRKLAGDRTIALVVDDDPVVVSAMQRAGYPTLHATWATSSEHDDRALRQAQEIEGRT